MALFWPHKAAQQRQTTQDAEQVSAGQPASVLVAMWREDFYGSDGRQVRPEILAVPVACLWEGKDGTWRLLADNRKQPLTYDGM